MIASILSPPSERSRRRREWQDSTMRPSPWAGVRHSVVPESAWVSLDNGVVRHQGLGDLRAIARVLTPHVLAAVLLHRFHVRRCPEGAPCLDKGEQHHLPVAPEFQEQTIAEGT